MNVALTTLLASHGDEGHHGWGLLWPLLWLGVIVTVVWLARRRWWASAPQSGADRARDILAERFARGEISSDEYRDRLDQLRSH
jgi:putative membrane protein